MDSQVTSAVFMVRPVNFGFNEQTAESNAFQIRNDEQQPIQGRALKEFEQLVETLKSNGVNVLVINDTDNPLTPDSIFPNNWISTHEDGTIFLYPMKAENRRFERRNDVIDLINKNFEVAKINDLSFYEKEGKFLEGTGSMVLDRKNKIMYACESIRTWLDPLNEFSRMTGYQTVTFSSVDENDKEIYHTNVMMCMGEKFAIICLDTIKDEQEKKKVVDSLTATGKEIVQITLEQLKSFAGNMLQLKGTDNKDLLIMSERAYNSLSQPQIVQLEKYCQLLHVPLDTIENNGGGSARCMIAELFLPLR